MITPNTFITNLTNDPLVKKMDRLLKMDYVTGPSNDAVKLAYLMHADPIVMFTECSHILDTLSGAKYIRFNPPKKDEVTLQPPWSFCDERYTVLGAEVKDALNAFYFYTLSVTEQLNQLSAEQLGF